MNSRQAILDKVKAAVGVLSERSALPSEDEVAALTSRLRPGADDADSLVACFAERLQAVGGVLLRGTAELEAYLAEHGATRGYLDPAVAELMGPSNLSANSTYERAEVDAMQFGVTRATMGIAETGTIVLTDRDTPNRLAALAPWVHVAALRESEIVRDVRQAMAAFDDDPSIVFVTGPSKTADIEGILIEGVHGPGKQACLLLEG